MVSASDCTGATIFDHIMQVIVVIMQSSYSEIGTTCIFWAGYIHLVLTSSSNLAVKLTATC